MTSPEQIDALVIGGGPAGLMAAGEMARAGLSVTLTEAKPSVGRKLLMAGKSGLNLTMDEPQAALLSRYSGALLEAPLRAFDAGDVQDWARNLSQKVFTGSSGRVFPVAMKASPLLRAWLAELRGLEVRIETRWRWRGWEGNGNGAAFAFDTPGGAVTIVPKVCVLAVGGASWARLGSDGAWAPWLTARGATVTPFAASNAGLQVAWTPMMARLYGAPVKGVAIHGGATAQRGEFVISARGLEGGGIYAVSPLVRAGVPVTLDLLPDWPLAKVAERLARPRGKASLGNWLRKALHLDSARLGLLLEFGQPLPAGAALAALVKALPLRHAGLRPIDEAISTVGGVAAEAVTPAFMLKALPGVFVAGEMIDWDAPTGGYLLTGCLATGRWAGRNAAGWVRQP